MYLTFEQINDLGISKADIKHNLATGAWQSRKVSFIHNRRPQEVVLVASLPLEIQAEWLQGIIQPDSGNLRDTLSEINGQDINDQDKKLIRAFLRFSPEERSEWIIEANRLAHIIERYSAIKPRRYKDPATGEYKFVDDVLNLCKEARCNNPIIIAREPHRKDQPSPYTLDGLLLKYRKEGLLTFLRNAPTITPNKPDMRMAFISKDAFNWVNSNWKEFSSSHYLYNTLEKLAQKKGWSIPSQSWFYREWNNMPEITKIFYLKGKSAYISKYAPYVPRDVSDLVALQVVCGDHSERDVTVLLPDNTLARPWISLWYDLRLGLIWGWHQSLIPSSYTAGLAYADGVRNFGAQPLSRPEEGFFSYVQTDHGRDYKSHNWDGTVIAVHEKAMQIDGGFEFLLTDRRVGILEEFGLKHMLAKRRNAREKPVERIFKIMSEWERNTFKEYCGRDAKNRPDTWYKLFAQHQQFMKGGRSESPFMTFEQYHEELARFISRFNSSMHERWTLGGKTIIPIEEYYRLYTTRYEISQQTLALLLMKAVKRVINKDGVQCFQKHWFYYHEAMSEFKGLNVEVRYTDGDYHAVWVILPNAQICEATLITPSPFLNPNKRTLKKIAEASAHERALIRDFNLLTQSRMRGETTEDRVAEQLMEENQTEDAATLRAREHQAVVHKMTRLDRKKLLSVADSHEVKPSEVADIDADASIFSTDSKTQISEFDYHEE